MAGEDGAQSTSAAESSGRGHRKRIPNPRYYRKAHFAGCTLNNKPLKYFEAISSATVAQNTLQITEASANPFDALSNCQEDMEQVLAKGNHKC